MRDRNKMENYFYNIASFLVVLFLFKPHKYSVFHSGVYSYPNPELNVSLQINLIRHLSSLKLDIKRPATSPKIKSQTLPMFVTNPVDVKDGSSGLYLFSVSFFHFKFPFDLLVIFLFLEFRVRVRVTRSHCHTTGHIR